MTSREDQQQIVNLLEDALARTTEALRIEQRMSHTPHPHPGFKEIEDRLEWLLNSERALLKRIGTLGR
jgi:hypothetical protein